MALAEKCRVCLNILSWKDEALIDGSPNPLIQTWGLQSVTGHFLHSREIPHSAAGYACLEAPQVRAGVLGPPNTLQGTLL